MQRKPPPPKKKLILRFEYTIYKEPPLCDVVKKKVKNDHEHIPY